LTCARGCGVGDTGGNSKQPNEHRSFECNACCTVSGC
jgi:hypothetical protein